MRIYILIFLNITDKLDIRDIIVYYLSIIVVKYGFFFSFRVSVGIELKCGRFWSILGKVYVRVALRFN